MAIQMRRGALANLDRSKLVAGEIVVATDEDFVGVAKAPSQVIQLATTDMLDLPVASADTLGGVKVGNNLSIDQNGVLSATGGGGTTVVANPSGTATDDLTKIQIGQTIYDVEGGSGEVVEMTYAEYQALTTEEKNDGTVRYVADYPSSDGGVTYSTTPHKVGTWIDGRDVWEKTIAISQLPNNTTLNVPHNISNMDFGWIYDGFYKNATSVNGITNRPVLATSGSGSWYTALTDTDISIQTWTDRTAYGGYITVRWVETT